MGKEFEVIKEPTKKVSMNCKYVSVKNELTGGSVMQKKDKLFNNTTLSCLNTCIKSAIAITVSIVN